MLLQLGMLPYILLYYLPSGIELGIFIAILVFGIFIYRRNQYKYGLFLIISAILKVVYYVIYFATNRPFLPLILVDDLGLSILDVNFILLALDALLAVINISSFILLFVAIYFIYQTHKFKRS
ncbi:MAG: hypothetical protein P8Y23_04345 [Candidatus Lokiarchaeota archaeon]